MNEKAGPRKGAPSLAEMQQWLGKAISRPLPDAYPGNPLAVSAPELQAEADALVREKGGLSGFGRVGIYNQQYWFRLISVMQSGYACAIHLMGLRAFNEWAVRYLEAHPPASPFLAELDAGFPAFLEQGYRGKERDAVLQAVAYERALSKAFDAPEGLSLAASGASAPEDLLAARFALAPHVTPLSIDWDFEAFRARCLPDESLEGNFELEPGSSTLVIFRDANLEIMKEPVSRPALAVLKAFEDPATLTGAFGKLEGDLGPEEHAELAAGITGWFRDWVARGWLCAAPEAGPGAGQRGSSRAPARRNKSAR